MKKLPDLLRGYVPDDQSHQVTSRRLVEKLFNENNEIRLIMDLGCGSGDSAEFFKNKNENIRWIGLDIIGSAEMHSRIAEDVEFYVFDGVRIPFQDGCFDLIFCNQVFEHVRYPTNLLREVNRVLRTNGYFVGSTSQLEPYHSLSLWNYTPYGFSLLLEEAGLRLKEIRPSIDALTLIVRRALGSPEYFSWLWDRESPLNLFIGLIGLIMRKRPAWINVRKLLFCGQFCFLAQK